MISKLEKKYKKLFRHRHVTNVEVDASTVGSQVRVYYRYKTNPKEMVNFIADKCELDGGLEPSYSIFADETKNYTYYVAFINIVK